MIIQSTAATIGPGFAGIVFSAALWVFTMLIVLLHRSGIQIVGALLACIGFIAFFIQPNLLVALPLFASGCAIHWFGRLLYHFRRKS